MATKVESAPQLKASDYKSDIISDWCPGCGDYGIVNALQIALAAQQIKPDQMVTYSGVGCSSKSPHLMQTYGVHTLHGRSLTFAAGTALCNPDMPVVITGGDGDGYGIGVGHFMHAGRRNVNMTYLVYNNEVYGLTKGQASPTLSFGAQPKSLPAPNPNDGVNPLAMAVISGYTFVARSYAFDKAHLAKTIQRAMEHQGMALVDILQPCPTYNNLHDKDYFAQTVEMNGAEVPRLYDMEAEGYSGLVKNPGDENEVREKELQAITKLKTKEDRIPLGVFFQVTRPTFMDRIHTLNTQLKETPAYKMPIADAKGKPLTNLTATYEEFRTDAY
ncbi:MAG: thiamine pyrophosphate-dependent enzyme [Candidatus Melainabacteria bacterium]